MSRASQSPYRKALTGRTALRDDWPTPWRCAGCTRCPARKREARREELRQLGKSKHRGNWWRNASKMGLEYYVCEVAPQLISAPIAV